MKRLWLSLAFLFLFSQLSFAELSVDGGLETWTNATTLTNWSYAQNGTGGSVNREATVVKAGTYSARLVKSTVSLSIIYQNINVSVGKSYGMSGWVKSSNSTANAIGLVFLFYDAGAGFLGASPWVYYQNSGDWENLTTSAVAPTGTATAQLALAIYNTGTADAYFDSISFNERKRIVSIT